MPEYPEKVYLNGTIVNSEEAKVSVFDRGFLFGDGLYEVMVQSNGHFLFGEMHLERLKQGLRKTRIKYDADTLRKIFPEVLEASGLTNSDCLLYIQITRGKAPRKHAFPSQASPTVLMYALPIEFAGINTLHAHVITMDDLRWLRCDIKTISLLGSVMANDTALQQGAYEAVFARNGRITEGSHSNIFFVKDRVVFTHPADEFILDGVTRQVTIALCNKLGIEVREQAILKKEIQTMDEAFLTGTTTQIASVKYIDEFCMYSDEKPGPVTEKIQNAYNELKRFYSEDHTL